MAWKQSGEIRVFKHEPDPESPWPAIIVISIIVIIVVSCCDHNKQSSVQQPQQRSGTRQVYQADRGL
jgi:hypothetical protein